ncbi:MAG: hypothetical protein ACREIT_02590, partial [Tepidisphaeraceae bacterium]
AWLLYGRGLFDADSGRQLDDLGIERAVGQRVVGKDTIHIMQSAGPAPGGAAGSGGFGARTATLAIVKLDLQRLTAKQQAAAGDDALPAPGPRPVRRNPGPPANGG